MNQRNLLSIIAVTGALLISGYGATASYAQERKSNSSQQQPKITSNKTKETISFKGISLGKPGVKNVLQQLCLESENNRPSSYSPDKDVCSFKDARTLIWLSYGILGHSLGWITLGSDEALNKVEIDGSKQEMLALADALEAKYGKPIKKKEQVENGHGTKFDKEIFIWLDNQGSRITVESIHSKVDEGLVVIESASSVAAQNAAEKLLREAAKSNL